MNVYVALTQLANSANTRTDVCVEVSAVCRRLSATIGCRLHAVQHPAAAS